MTTTTKRPDGGELKPCPFCGSEAVISVSRDGDVCNVRCSKWEPGYCLGAGPNTYSELTAIAAWNARTPDPYRDAIDEALIVRHLGVAKGDAKAELEIVLAWEVSVALDPLVSSSAQALIDQGRSESPAPQAEASEHAPWSEDEEDAERLLACASRRKKYGDENCECDEDGSCVECEYDMQDVLKKRYAPLKHTTTPAPQPPVEGLREALETISGLSVSLRAGGPDYMDLQELSDALERACEVADTALAALAPVPPVEGLRERLLGEGAICLGNCTFENCEDTYKDAVIPISVKLRDDLLAALATLIEQSGQKETQTAKPTSSRTEASATETAGGEA